MALLAVMLLLMFPDPRNLRLLACFRDGATTPALHGLAVVLAAVGALLVVLTVADCALGTAPRRR